MSASAHGTRHPRPLRIAITAGLVNVAVVALAACGSSAGSASSSSIASGGGGGGTTTIKVGYFPAVAPTFFLDVGQKQGFFTQNGIKPDLVSLSSGPSLVTSLVSNSVNIVDTGLSNLAPVITGQKFPAVALMGGQKAQYQLVVEPSVRLPRANEPFPAPIQDLKGLKIGVTGIGGVPDLFLKELLKSAGMDESQVTPVSLGTAAAQIAAFKAKSVDAEVIYPPLETELGTQGTDYKVVADTVTGKNSESFNGWVNEAWFTTSSFISDNRGATTAFCKAMNSAQQWALDPSNAAAAGALFASWTGLQAGQGPSAWQAIEHLYQPKLTQSVWQAQAPFAFPSGGLPPYAVGVDAACAAIFPAS